MGGMAAPRFATADVQQPVEPCEDPLVPATWCPVRTKASKPSGRANRTHGRTELQAALALFALLIGGCVEGRRVVSGFGDWNSCEVGYRRPIPHMGIDIGGSVGEPVLAAADGIVTSSGDDSAWECGRSVHIRHTSNARTVYCHLSRASAQLGSVNRGEIIGYLGTTGQPPGRGCEHVHFELHQGGRDRATDPLPFIKGCFDPNRVYPETEEELVLTWPLRCRPTQRTL